MTNTRRAVFLDHPSLDLGDLDLSPLRECFSDLQLFAQTLPEQVSERLQGALALVSGRPLAQLDQLFAPLRLPADLDFPGMFHGVDERVPRDSLAFGRAVLRDLLLNY